MEFEKSIKRFFEEERSDPDFHQIAEGIAFHLGMSVEELESIFNNPKRPPKPHIARRKLERNLIERGGDMNWINRHR